MLDAGFRRQDTRINLSLPAVVAVGYYGGVGSLFPFIKNEDSCVSVRSLFGLFDDRPAQVFPLQHQLDLVVQFIERRRGGQSLQPVGTPSDKEQKKIDR